MPLPTTRCTLAAVFCFSPVLVHAQAAVPQLENIVVTANRQPQALAATMGDITVVSREELQRSGADSLSAVLARQPGIQMTDNGGRQTPTGIMLRGANANHTLLLIDGVRVNSAVQGGANWMAMDTAAIERIEILRGAASSLYGSDAIGGVINVITRKGDTSRPLSAWADFGIGSQSTVRAATGFSGAEAGWDYALTASMAESEGYSATSEDAAYGNHHADPDGYQQHSLSGSLGYRWGSGQHLGLTFYNSYIDGDYDAGEWNHPARSLTRQQAYSLTSTNQLSRQWQSVLRFGLSKESYDDRVWDARFSTLLRSYSWQNNIRFTDDHKLALYVERIEERPQHSADMQTTRRDTNAVGAIYNGRFGRHSVQASLRNDSISNYGNELTGGLGYDLDLTDHLTVGVAGNTGFHAPTFSDLYYPGSENPDLQPEHSRNIEAHVRYERNGLQLDATVYQNKIRDLLAWDNTTFRMENVDRATILGATLTAGYEWRNTTLRASADFMRPRDDGTGERLLRRARHQYSMSAEHRLDDLRLGAEYLFTGEREDLGIDPTTFESYRTRLGSYGLLNLTAAYDFSSKASVQVRWNNVFDKNHTLAHGYRSQGSNVFINLSLRM